MDKNAIRKYAVWARRELIERVSQKALFFGISTKDTVDATATSIDGRLLTSVQQNQRKALIARIREHGFEQVMEEVAYTWFNRFCAIRFMEVNGYLPSHVRVFTDDNNAFKPQILTEAIHLEIDGLDMEKVYALKEANDTEALFRYLLITQCNALSAILPGMFQKIEDYTELLLPDFLLREGSAIEQMVALIPEDNWTDQVQIIGWLYQYYNSEPKDKVFENLKKNIKISKENIPAATQLFTPDWIVRYMVENSLGRLWVEGHPNEELKSNWKYYIEEAQQEPDVETQLKAIRAGYAQLKPEDILCIDPCMGSGHILCYMFDVLVQIYEAYGYTAREAASMILKNNLWGLDIDDRAAQLAYFAVMMKARQYDRRIFNRNIQPNVFAIQESNGINLSVLRMTPEEQTAARLLVDTFHDAKEYGSILTMSDKLMAAIDRLPADAFAWEGTLFAYEGELLTQLCLQARALGQKYCAVITNPPYMASANGNEKLNDYIKTYYPDGKTDLFAVFIERCKNMLTTFGLQAMITQHTWMFLGSYEALRKKIQKSNIDSLVHLGIKAFEEIGNDVVQTVSFVLRNSSIRNHLASFIRLVDYKDYFQKQVEFHSNKNRYCQNTSIFELIPGGAYAYWVNSAFVTNFSEGSSIDNYGEFTGSQNITGNNDKFLRCFWEIQCSVNRHSKRNSPQQRCCNQSDEKRSCV